MVGFGLQAAGHRTRNRQRYLGITPDKVKTMLLGAAQDKIAKYSGGGNIMKHEAGKDGVQMAMFVVGVVKGIAANASKIVDLEDVVSKLDDVAEESLELVSKQIDEATGRLINKALKENNVDPQIIESTALTLADNPTKKWTFPQLQALWKRGNDFNAKRAQDYLNNEVWVTHPTKKYPVGHKNAGQPRRYRLDAYDHVNGYIVSRKATTLSEISESTFIKYLDEILEKYPEGSKIARTGIGPELKGKFRLEIPDINESFSKLQEYKDLAASKGIELLIKAE